MDKVSNALKKCIFILKMVIQINKAKLTFWINSLEYHQNPYGSYMGWDYVVGKRREILKWFYKEVSFINQTTKETVLIYLLEDKTDRSVSIFDIQNQIFWLENEKQIQHE
jgi:hypothetical protein